uniref:Uncharacterized protein n=1 Tax=Cacopsylla melanoneura TaxID=428564 RepID=A0A8D8UP24_9HEMI
MKSVSFAVLSIFFLAQFSDAASIVTGVNDDVESLVDDITGTEEAITDRAVNLTIKETNGEEESVSKEVQVIYTETFELSGLPKEVEQVERIAVRQPDTGVSIVLKRVSGLVFRVDSIIKKYSKKFLTSLVSGIETKLSLFNNAGGAVLVDVANVKQLVLKTVKNTGESVTSLVLSLVPNSV